MENVFNRVLALSAKKYFGSKKTFSSTAKFVLSDKENNPILQLNFSEPFSNDKNVKKRHCQQQWWDRSHDGGF